MRGAQRIIFITLLGGFAVACSQNVAEERETQTEDRVESNHMSKIIYQKNLRGTLPERIVFSDGSSWELHRVTPPWEVISVSENAFVLEASTTALGIPHLDIDAEQQKYIKISLGYNPDYVWASPQRYKEMLEQDLAVEYPKYSSPPFLALQAGNKGPYEGASTSLVDFERNLVCDLNGQLRPNPFLLCERMSGGHVFKYHLPAAALEQLDALINQFTEVLHGLSSNN